MNIPAGFALSPRPDNSPDYHQGECDQKKELQRKALKPKLILRFTQSLSSNEVKELKRQFIIRRRL
jgi:hypothetical protein